MTTTIAILVAGYALALWLMLRHLRDHVTATRAEHAAIRGQHAHDTRLFLEAIERERDAKRDEVQQLCQRIQAPDMATVQHMQQDAPDENPWPLTERETVEAQDERLMILDQIEQMEREATAALGFTPGER